MTAVRIVTESTHYFTVAGADGHHRDYVRTPFGEWCTELATQREPELTCVKKELAVKLEEIFQTTISYEALRH